jgi:hypothetical protein
MCVVQRPKKSKDITRKRRKEGKKRERTKLDNIIEGDRSVGTKRRKQMLARTQERREETSSGWQKGRERR